MESEPLFDKPLPVGPEHNLQGQPVIEAVRKIVPEHLDDLFNKDWIHWEWIARCHPDMRVRPVTALFEAYQFISKELDLDTLAGRNIPEDSSGCRRCGWCCAYLRPGFVSASIVRRLRGRGAIVAEFYRPVGRGRNPRHGCWFFGGARLSICPLLFRNRIDKKVFCSIHHLGKKFRPPTCGRFQPSPPQCETAQLPHFI